MNITIIIIFCILPTFTWLAICIASHVASRTRSEEDEAIQEVEEPHHEEPVFRGT